MFDISGQASMTLNFLSFDCDMKMDYYSRLVLVFFLPLLVCCVIALIYIITHFIRKKTAKQSFDDFQLTTMIVLSLIHPYLFQESISIFKCDKVVDKLYLVADYSVSCEDDKYTQYVVVVILFLLFYIFGAMGALLYRGLYHNAKSKKLFQTGHSSNVKYSFFTQGYRENTYFWEGVVMGRKMAIVLFAVILNSQLQLFFSGLVLLYAYHATTLYTPFKSKHVNNMENLSLVALCITASMGAIFLSSSDSTDTTWTTVVLVMVNVVVMVYLVWNCAVRGVSSLKNFLPKKKDNAVVAGGGMEEFIEYQPPAKSVGMQEPLL